MNKYIYPLGSVVSIKNNEFVVLITGYAIENKKIGKTYEYCGYELPLGYNPDRTFLFNNEDIAFPVFIGHKSEEKTRFRYEISRHYSDNKLPFFPIGSVVETAYKKELMIIGYVTYNLLDTNIYDYVGIDDDNNTFYFNKEDIKEIDFIGCVTDDYKNLAIYMEDVYKDIREKKNILPKIEARIKEMEKEEENK